MARALREALDHHSQPLSHSAALEIVARQFGLADWNTLAATIDADTPAAASKKPANDIALQTAIPILRIFDLAKATEFYLEFLGFGLDWEHRFAPTLPIYMQVSRSGLTLHLSEHHGDASPGSTAFVWMRGIDAYHAELLGKHYPYSRPGIEEDGPGGRTLQVPDPFGNRLRFCEKRD